MRARIRNKCRRWVSRDQMNGEQNRAMLLIETADVVALVFRHRCRRYVEEKAELGAGELSSSRRLGLKRDGGNVGTFEVRTPPFQYCSSNNDATANHHTTPPSEPQWK